MPIGLILLVAVSALVLFGAAQRVLDRLRLTDRQALLFAALIFGGGLIPDIRVTNLLRVNVGGCLVPLILCGYLLAKAGTAWEKWRTVLSSLLTAAAVFLLGRYLPNEPEAMPFDVNYAYGIAAGLVAFAFGGSRRGAFVAGITGVLMADALQALWNWQQGITQPLRLGGAGGLDAVVIAGLVAVLLTELMGELLERASRGRRAVDERAFEGGEIRKEDERE